jgi:hypothetical protein
VDVPGPIEPLDVRGFEAALAIDRGLVVTGAGGDTVQDTADLIAQIDQAQADWMPFVTAESDPLDAGAVDSVTADIQSAAADASVRQPPSDSPAGGELDLYLDARNLRLINELPLGTNIILGDGDGARLPGSDGSDGTGVGSSV